MPPQEIATSTGRDGQPPRQPIVWKEGNPLEAPPPTLFFHSVLPCPALLFLKAKSLHIGKLQIVYMGNVSCLHVKIYTSLSPKCLRLEIERTVSWTDLLFTDGTTANEH